MHARFPQWMVAVFTALSLILGMAAAASADNLVPDGDGVTPVAASSLSFGTVCAGATTSKPVLLGISRNGAANNNANNNVFANGSSQTVSVLTVTPPLSVTMTDSATLVASNWSTTANNTIAGNTALASVTFVAGATGPYVGVVGFRARGTNASGAVLDRDANIAVSASVVNCDTTPPVLNLPGNITTEATGPAGAVVSYTATATDAAPAEPVVSCSKASGSTFAIGTTTVDCSATDAVGNSASGSFTVTVRDTTAPAITGAPGSFTVEATGPSGATVTYTNPSASDVVDGARPVSCSPTSGSTFPLGPSTITCSASDTRGNSASTSFTITVSDTTKPSLVVPGDIAEEATSAAGAAVTYSATASDTVDTSVVASCAPASGSIFAIATTAVACSASDDSGNTATGGFKVTVRDTTPPVFGALPAPSEEATGPAGAAVAYGPVTATDLVDGSVTATCTPASGATFALGSTTVNCTATDSRGNTRPASFDVVVVDTTPPSITLPADQLLEATGPGGATATFSVGATDLVDTSVAISCDAASGAVFALGVTTVKCTATDDSGNKAEGQFTIKVQDTTAPAITITPAGNQTLEATGPGGATATYSASAIDLVDGTVATSCAPASGGTFAIATTTVTCTATDAAGNKATATVDVTVQDTTGPVIAEVADVTKEATGPTGAVVTYTATASDLVDGAVTPSCAPPSGGTFAIGISKVTCNATDAHGNAALPETFDVKVVDTTKPALTLPANITVDPTSAAGAVVTYSASASDIVDGAMTPSCNPASGSTFTIGTTTVNCSATDAAGNTAMGAFTVTVKPLTLKGFYQPVDMSTTGTVLNTVKAGSTVPFKFEVFAGSTELSATSVVKSFGVATVTCASGAEDAIEEFTTTGATSLRYDTTGGQFIQNWQTPKTPGACLKVTMTTTDNNTLVASFKLK